MLSWKKSGWNLAVGVSAAAVTLAGCSSAGVNSATSGVAITSAAKTSITPLVTDAPGDQVLALGSP